MRRTSCQARASKEPKGVVQSRDQAKYNYGNRDIKANLDLIR